ncbi:MAG: helix-turn-helix domain-containing protein, partial [Candidatus Corynebacterium faecigallinarum]
LRDWVNEQLGELAAHSDNAARLRETYSVFPDSGASFTRTGGLMMLHRNTVKYRIEQARALIGAENPGTPAENSVALHMCRLLGPSVLSTDTQEE